jgi:predicted site-specific integrase-resolvase
MSLGKTWFTPEEMEAKVGVSKALILKWVDEGLVRCEREGDTVVRVNIDDVNLEVEALSKNP